jgi:hypothetical protein
MQRLLAPTATVAPSRSHSAWHAASHLMNKQQGHWIGSNALLAVALYVGVWCEQSLVGYLVAAFIWVMFTSYVAVLYSSPTKPRARPVPIAIGLLFDAVVLGVLVTCRWPLTATSYALSVLAHEAIFWRAARPPVR